MYCLFYLKRNFLRPDSSLYIRSSIDWAQLSRFLREGADTV
jgi:hypothetical protein